MSPGHDDAASGSCADRRVSRRSFFRGAGSAVLGAAASGCSGALVEDLLRRRLAELSPEELERRLAELERRYLEMYRRTVSVEATPAREGVVFGYGLDLSRCVGCRRCVYGCVHENNQSRAPQVHWIRVLEIGKEQGIDFAEADAYYDPQTVPEEESFYLPVACQQCRRPPCTRVCPVKATWQEADGIVVIDYEWCIGCRCCMAACPYGARRFNWARPLVPAEVINPETHYLGNRPRMKGVVEKCTFCIHRARKGRYPACVEICPVGARKFGNLLDEGSEIRYLMREKRVFVLKEELDTQPRFYYFYAT